MPKVELLLNCSIIQLVYRVWLRVQSLEKCKSEFESPLSSQRSHEPIVGTGKGCLFSGRTMLAPASTIPL